jgi:hypothetical protein
MTTTCEQNCITQDWIVRMGSWQCCTTRGLQDKQHAGACRKGAAIDGQSAAHLVSPVDEALSQLVNMVLYAAEVGVEEVTDHQDAQALAAPILCRLLIHRHDPAAVPTPGV